MPAWSIRPYDGTLADARGILAVEQQTFRECPYSPAELQARLGARESLALVAVAEGRLAGFLSGLRTSGLDGPRLEADLLAVDPAWQGQGIATALLLRLRRAAADVAWLRGVVRPANHASERAFARAGFQPSEETCDLLVYRILGTVSRPLAAWGGAVRPLASREEAAALAALAPGEWPAPERLWEASVRPGLTVAVAAQDGAVVGGVGLIEVHTLLYSGVWVEGLASADGAGRPMGRRRPLGALAAWVVEAAKARQLDAVGCLVPASQPITREMLVAEGFRLLDSYRTWTAAPLGERAR